MTEMAKIDLPYVQVFKDRHGKLRHYYRRGRFPRIPLPGVPGSEEFMAAYAGRRSEAVGGRGDAETIVQRCVGLRRCGGRPRQ